jgi:hypothetical protein
VRLLKKKNIGAALILLVLAGVLGTLPGRSLLATSKDEGETSLDTEDDQGDAVFPLLGFYVYSDSSRGGTKYAIQRESVDTCNAKVDGVEDLTPSQSNEYSKLACVRNEEVLYRVKRLTISDCRWDQYDNGKVQVLPLKRLMKEYTLENLKVLFRNDTLICEADLLLPNGTKTPVGGPCAVAESTNFGTVNGQKPMEGNHPLFASFSLMAKNNALEKEIARTPGVGLKSNFMLFTSIPLSLTGTQYLMYMLSKESMEACENIKK